MPTRDSLRRAIVEALTPLLRGTAPTALTDETRLDRDGLGLDSIALAELLYACEARLGHPFPASLLAGEPLTLGRLLDHAAIAPER